MRAVKVAIALLLSMILIACSTKKSVQSSVADCTDSKTSSVSVRSDSVGTELLTSVYVNFDSLEVDVIPCDSVIRSVRLKARRASISRQKSVLQSCLSSEIVTDTAASHRTLATSAKDRSESTKVVKPPNMSIVVFIVLLVSLLVFIIRHLINKQK